MALRKPVNIINNQIFIYQSEKKLFTDSISTFKRFEPFSFGYLKTKTNITSHTSLFD